MTVNPSLAVSLEPFTHCFEPFSQYSQHNSFLWVLL